MTVALVQTVAALLVLGCGFLAGYVLGCGRGR